MKKYIQVIALIIFIAVIFTNAGQLTQHSLEKGMNENTIQYSLEKESNKDTTQYSPEKESEEAAFDIMLEWFQDWYQGRINQQAVCYQLAAPCHFFLNVYPGRDPVNTYEYRNIDESDEILWNEDGRMNTVPAYIADVVLDTYIREYGGEDTQYHMELGIMSWKEPELSLDYSMKIYSDSEILNVIWDGNLQGAISVYIEDHDGAEVQYERMIEYAYHMDKEGYYNYFRKHWENAYCMFADPQPGQKKYHYRNIQPTDSAFDEDALICDAFGYAIADRAIDKYIRDWGV